MRREYISKSKNYFKANLHCHSVCSDGSLTPEELKKIYREQGYNIVAYSDHNVLVDHSDLNDEHFLAMIATEYDIKRAGPEDSRLRPCYHINFYPKKSHQIEPPCLNPIYDWENGGKKRNFTESGEYVRFYEEIQDLIDRFADAGFLVQINHPVWSLQSVTDYLPLHNFFSLELYNNSCFVSGFDEFNTGIWDDLLRSGKRIVGTATDDNHNHHPNHSPRWDSFGGFTVIQADALTQESVTAALEAGDFYASTGPLFYEIVREGNLLRVETSPVAKVLLTSGMREACIATPKPGENTLTSCEFDLSVFLPDGYLRLTLIDEHGNRAWSQPIYDYAESGT